MARDSLGSSPSHRMAVCLARLGRWRSTQLAQTFSVPSSNHLMNRLSGSHETFLTFVKGLIQSIRLASSRQKPSGSFSARLYISLYLRASMKARDCHSGGTEIRLSDMAFPYVVASILIRFRQHSIWQALMTHGRSEGREEDRNAQDGVQIGRRASRARVIREKVC